MNRFQFFLMTTVVHLGLCWNYPCFKGKLAFTLMNGLECHSSPAFNSFFKQINQVRCYWMCSSTGAFLGVLLNIKSPHKQKNNPNKKAGKSLWICRSIILNNKRLLCRSFISGQRRAGRWDVVGVVSAWREVLMCVNTLKAMGPFLGDGLSLLN